MPRPPRLDPPGGRHHVMNRGARRAPVFVDEAAVFDFLAALEETARRFGVAVHGYVLMPNHYHLLVTCPHGNLSVAMRYLGARFARALHARHAGWDGPVFRGRFKNRLVEDDAFWMHLLAYVHLNPVRAGLVARPERYPWSSHAAYVGLATVPSWLATDEHLALFGTVDAYREHVRAVQVRRGADPDAFDPEDFEAPVKSARAPRAVPQARRTAHEAMADVAEVTGVGTRELATTRRGPAGNPAKWLAAFWLARAAGLPLAEVGRRLNASEALVSRWVSRVARSHAEPLVGWVRELEARGSA